MTDISILIERLNERGWKYKDSEIQILRAEIPSYISLDDLAYELIKSYNAKPTLKSIIGKSKHLHYKKRVEKSKIIHEGCHNCEKGYVKVANCKSFFCSEIKFNPINLMELQEYSTIRIPCTCTGVSPNISNWLEDLKQYQITHPTHYEIFYLILYGFMSMWLVGERFKDFNQFNPFAIWNVAYDEANLLRSEELQFRHLFGHTTEIKNPKMKKIVDNIEDTYKNKLYEEE